MALIGRIVRKIVHAFWTYFFKDLGTEFCERISGTVSGWQ